ncbi:MAG: right-handed parallel beta-helix repeat-containing protein [Chthoniobacter sp.]|uniref:right-handed parallel beta-helix repeat-containing protein n=1 Tax=Chthoniobacter sp. TaxID=2510640 RepID=UPI0032A261AD
MINPRRFALIPFLQAALLAALTATTAHGTDWYVAPNGDDAWSGKLPAPNAEKTDGPFAHLSQARDAVRDARKAGDTSAMTVQVRAGLYELSAGLKLDAQDSGTAEAPVVWRAFENEKPVLIGGLAISHWDPWKDGILQTDVRMQGFKGAAFKQLFFGGQRQILARYPNYDPQNPYGGGWAYADGEMWPMYADKEGEDKHTLLVKPQDWRTWARPEDVEVFVFPRYNWWNDILRVKSVDAEKHTVTTAKDGSYAMRANDRFYFQGALEDLDAPGEWYLDRQTWTLYFKPPAAIDSAPVYAPTTRDIIAIENANYVTLRGFTLECADGSAVVLTKANHCRVVGCTVRNVGDFSGTGISVREGTDNGVVGCDISQTGSNGVSLSGGDRPTLTNAGNFVDNCYIHHVGVFYKQGVGVALSGVGQRVSHCLIHDTPRFAIQFGGNNHLLEYNHLRHLALETEDVGATYCGGRDWLTPRGTVIRYNFIHDVLGFGWNGKWTSPYFAWGIYLDDNSGGVDVTGNIVARCGRSCIHGHSARDCRVENNIFVEGGMRQWEFNGWTVKQRFWETTLPQMEKGYEAVANLPAWKGLRGMDVPPEKIPDSEGRVMSGDIFTRNIIAWKNPEAKALNVVNFNPARNQFDRNLYWHDGLPLKTGQHKAGKVISGNLAPNPSFQDGGPNALPKDWQWQIHTPGGTAGVTEDNGAQSLRIDAAYNHEKKRDNYPIVVSHDVELKPGGAYRLHARLRTDQENAKASLMLQFFLPATDGQPAHFWASSPSEAKITPAWQDFEFAFSIPAKGEKGWHEKMKNFRVRLDWAAEKGALYAADVALEETESLDEWQSWQALGDQHSIIADPKFLAPEKDDYRLAPDSPAWALGFQPIPVEKMGPYASPDRATWPIVEAEGAREHPIAP